MSFVTSAPGRFLVAVSLSFGLTGLVDAKPIDDRLSLLTMEVEQVRLRTDDLAMQVAPGRGFITKAQATQRFQDCVYLHMVGEYALAAEGFFALVTTAALGDAGLHQDAEWYLAESLFQLGNYATAEARFQIIAEDESHPFRSSGPAFAGTLCAHFPKKTFYRYYEREILRGRVEASDMIRYTVAKNFYQQDNLVQSKSHFLEIKEGSDFFHRAQYFLATIMVREGDLDAARPTLKRYPSCR